MTDVLGLSFPTKEEHYVVALSRSRELALSIATLAAIGERPGEDEASPMPQEAEYIACIARIETSDVRDRFGDLCGEELALAASFGKRIADGRVAALSREEGVELLAHVRTQVLPALARLSEVILAQAARDQNDVLESLRGRIERLEGLFASMNEVGRTIHLVALNASIEAARAGGNSGRVFARIAKDIRALAGEASDLVALAQGQIERGDRSRPTTSGPPRSD